MNELLAEMNGMAASGLAALLNTLWYGGAVVLLTWAGLRCWPRVNAATRYWIWTAVLGFLLLLPFLPGFARQARTALAAREQAAGWQLARLAMGVASVRRLKAHACSAAFAFQRCGLSPGDEFATPLLREFHNRPAFSNHSPLPRERVARAGAFTRRRGPGEGLFPDFTDPRLRADRLRRPVRLLTSTEIGSPVAVGYRRPAVIIPSGLLERLEEGELQSVLLHELAHLARYDDWMTLVTRALGALLVLHPLAAIVLRRIEREREMACDDFVVAHTGSARSYARSLARLHDLRWSAGSRLLASGILGRHSSLEDRIESLLRHGREFSARPSLGSLGVSALLFAVLLAASGLIPSWIAIAQTKAALPTPKFEVISIKPSKPGTRGGSMHIPPGGFTTTNEPLKMIIGWAYNYKRPGFSLNEDQIRGGPSWINSERFDIVAKVPDSLIDQEEKKLPFDQWADQIRLMVQSMFAQRFKLKVSYETKELPIYALVVAKHGPKLTESKMLPPGPLGSYPPGPLMHMGRDQLAAMGAPIGMLAYALSQQPELGGREVVDQTRLKGRYVFALKWTPWQSKAGGMAASPGFGGDTANGVGTAPAPDSSGPSIFTAIQQQLGLKLKPEKGSVEVLVIDHIEPPSPN